MKYLFSFTLILISNILQAQNKSDTESWIKFQLNKYFPVQRITLEADTSYYDESTVYSYSFVSNYFVIEKTKNIRYKKYGSYKVEGTSRDIIDLSKIIKIENKLENSAFETKLMDFTLSFYNAQDYSGCYNFLYVNSPNFEITKENIEKVKSTLTSTCVYDLKYFRLDIDEKDIFNRLFKAFNHLVVLNGGKLIKDVF